MYLVLLAAAVAILVGVVAVAMGWGGEIAASRRDLPEVPVRARTAAEVATLRLPLGLFGYQQEATEVALHAIARTVAGREAEIASLRDEVQRLRAQAPGPPAAEETARGVPASGETADGDRAVERSATERDRADGAGEVLSGRGNVGGQPPAGP